MIKSKALYIVDPHISYLLGFLRTIPNLRLRVLPEDAVANAERLSDFLANRILLTSNSSQFHSQFLCQAPVDEYGIVAFETLTSEVSAVLNTLTTFLTERIAHLPPAWILTISNKGETQFKILG